MHHQQGTHSLVVRQDAGAPKSSRCWPTSSLTPEDGTSASITSLLVNILEILVGQAPLHSTALHCCGWRAWRAHLGIDDGLRVQDRLLEGGQLQREVQRRLACWLLQLLHGSMAAGCGTVLGRAVWQLWQGHVTQLAGSNRWLQVRNIA